MRFMLALLVCLSTAFAVEPPPPAARTDGLTLHVYDVGLINRLQGIIAGQTPNHSRVIKTLNLDGVADFAGGTLGEGFIAEARGFLRIDTAGEYAFSLRSDDGSILTINGKTVVDHDGLHGDDLQVSGTVSLLVGEHELLVRMFDRAGGESLHVQWKPPGATAFADIPYDRLFTQANQVHVTSPGRKRLVGTVTNTRSGDGEPLASVHPAFDLTDVHTEAFQPRVGGIDFFPDGRLAICTWDRSGDVYIIDHPADAARRMVRRFASGLAEPLGLKVLDGDIFVLQKQELTRLIDHNHDGVADEYRCVSDVWPVTANFHEFAFGLAYVDGYFYANLAVAIDPGGRTTVPQIPADPATGVGRGQVVRIDARTGRVEPVAMGLRTPNGIGVGPGGGLFITDNQGDWLPCSRIVRAPLHPPASSGDGVFFGARLTPDHAWADRPVTPPIVWLPQGEIGNSPSEPTELRVGPWKGQLLHGDVTHGGLKRTFLETVEGVEQGCVFRFSQGFSGGVNRLAWAPDGSLYVGQIGSTGNWGQTGKKWFGLQRLQYNGRVPFEMHAVRAAPGGFVVEFTQPLAEGAGWEPTHYHVEQYRYQPTNDYGGDRLDLRVLPVSTTVVAPDRRSVQLRIEGLADGHVVYLRLADLFRSDSAEKLWSTEAWYTLNRRPSGISHTDDTATPAHNTLSPAEESQGWKLLFDGRSLDGWSRYGQDDAPPEGWQVIDGTLARTASGGDIQTRGVYGDFELSLEWKVSEGGNSGIFFRVDPTKPAPWHTGPEMQVLDNARHPDGNDIRTSAGACYGLIAPAHDTSLGSMRWNQARIVARGAKVEYFLNNEKLLEFDADSPQWRRLVAESKFGEFPDFAVHRTGRIVLQDHGDRVHYRNIKLRELK